MLRYHSAKRNKWIREPTLLQHYPFLSDLDMLKAMVYPHGMKYVLYSKVEDTYYIAFVNLDGTSEVISKHVGRVEDLDWLMTFL